MKNSNKVQKVTYVDFEPDSVVDAVINKFVVRAEAGFVKYNATLDRKDLTVSQWIDHALEEHMDAILYLTKLKEELSCLKKSPQ